MNIKRSRSIYKFLVFNTRKNK